jgi:hypothetical protein
MVNSGWYARRRGILEHLERGTVSLLDIAIHDFLCLTADFRKGVTWASAEKIHALCPSGFSLKAIQRSLAKLESLGWLKRFRTHGKKGNYPIVIGKFFVRDVSLSWFSVNLEKTSDYRNVQFDPVTDPSFVTDSSRTSFATEVGTHKTSDAGSQLSPLKELRNEELRSEDELGRTKRDVSPENGDMPPQSGGADARASQTESQPLEMVNSLGPRELKGLKKTLEKILRDRRMPEPYRESVRLKLNQVADLLRSPR